MGHGHGADHGHGAKEKSLIPVILVVAFLGYGFGFALRGTDDTPRPFQPNAGPGYYERLPEKGPADAPVVLIEVADLRCIYCMKRNSLVKRLVAEHGDDVRVVFKHFPFVSPDFSEAGAIASMAANRQGRFWEYVDTLYLHRDEPWTSGALVGYAEALGLDAAEFARDLEDRSLRSYVRFDREAAEAVNVRATPTLFVNGLVVPNWANATDVRKMIRESKREVMALVESGQAADIIEARAMVAAKNHPSGENFATHYMYNDVSELRVLPGSN